MSKKEKKRLTPKLRFPEFLEAGEWQVEKLKRLAKRTTLRNSGGIETRVLTNSAEFGVIDQRDYFDKDIANQNNLAGYYVIEEGDYVYNPRVSTLAPVGPISKNKVGTGVMSPLYTVFRFHDNNNDFYEQYFKTAQWHSYMRIVSNSGARHDRIAISNADFIDIPLPKPHIKEQQKIADCLSSIDDLIIAQTQKLNSLKAHKKGLMQQIFPTKVGTLPQLRFPEFRDKGEWKFLPLNRLAKRCTQKNRAGKIIRVLTNSAEYGVIDQRDYFDKDIANQGNLEGYFIVENGDYVYNSRISTIAPVGPISKNKLETGVMSPLYTIFRFYNRDNDFYAHYFKSTGWHAYMRQASSTGARHDRMAVTNDDFMAMPLPVTSEEEQHRIADCLSSIDELITAQSQKLNSLKAHKKGLMQQLFPAMDEVGE